jgi:hypothetical protein
VNGWCCRADCYGLYMGRAVVPRFTYCLLSEAWAYIYSLVSIVFNLKNLPIIHQILVTSGRPTPEQACPFWGWQSVLRTFSARLAPSFRQPWKLNPLLSALFFFRLRRTQSPGLRWGDGIRWQSACRACMGWASCSCVWGCLLEPQKEVDKVLCVGHVAGICLSCPNGIPPVVEEKRGFLCCRLHHVIEREFECWQQFFPIVSAYREWSDHLLNDFDHCFGLPICLGVFNS